MLLGSVECHWRTSSMIGSNAGMGRLLSSFVTLAFAAVAAPLAWAEPIGEGTLNAVAFEPMPADAALEVRVLDDSDENLAIKREMEAALTGRGFRIGTDDAPLVLTIDTGESVAAWHTDSQTDRVPMMDDRGRLFPQGELDVTRQVRLPLPRTTVVTPAQYRIGVTIDDRASGVRIWQGWTIADLSQGEPAELASAMVPKLADSLGRTVREERFPLQ
jgi:hypothetical protein